VYVWDRRGGGGEILNLSVFNRVLVVCDTVRCSGLTAVCVGLLFLFHTPSLRCTPIVRNLRTGEVFGITKVLPFFCACCY